MTSTINSLYDVLGWVAFLTITGNIIFSDVCNKKLTWDEPVPPDVEKRWKDWPYILEQSKSIALSRSVQTYARSYFNLHGFSENVTFFTKPSSYFWQGKILLEKIKSLRSSKIPVTI